MVERETNSQEMWSEMNERQKMNLVKSWTNRIDELTSQLAQTPEDPETLSRIEKELTECHRKLAKWMEGGLLESGGELTASDRSQKTQQLNTQVTSLTELVTALKSKTPTEQMQLLDEIGRFSRAILTLRLSMKSD